MKLNVSYLSAFAFAATSMAAPMPAPGINGGLDSLGGTLNGVFKNLGKTLQGTFGNLGATTGTLLANVGGTAGGVLSGVGDTVDGALDGVGDTVDGLLGAKKRRQNESANAQSPVQLTDEQKKILEPALRAIQEIKKIRAQKPTDPKAYDKQVAVLYDSFTKLTKTKDGEKVLVNYYNQFLKGFVASNAPAAIDNQQKRDGGLLKDISKVGQEVPPIVKNLLGDSGLLGKDGLNINAVLDDLLAPGGLVDCLLHNVDGLVDKLPIIGDLLGPLL